MKQEFERIKKLVEKAEKESAVAEGEIRAIEKRLKTDFDCDSIEDAEELEKELEEKITKMREELGQRIEAFKEKYKDELDRIDAI